MGGWGKRQNNHRAVGAASCPEAWFLQYNQNIVSRKDAKNAKKTNQNLSQGGQEEGEETQN